MITTGLDCNLMARDPRCVFQLKIECGDRGIIVTPWAPVRQCYSIVTPHWWSLDLDEEPPLHIKLAYDRSGKDRELETFFKSYEGQNWEIEVLAQVEGKEGAAEYGKIPAQLWKRPEEVAPHFTRKVNFPAKSKDLGTMVRKAFTLANPNNYQKQHLSNQYVVEFYQAPRKVVTRLRHHLGSEVYEYVDPQV